MKKIIYYLLTPVSLFMACQAQQKDQEKEIIQTIDQLHNQAMVINEKAIKTKFRLDSVLLQKNKLGNKDTVAIKFVIAELNHADEKMMDWMHHFQLDYKGSKTEALIYFKNQLDSLKQVQLNLENAIEQAKPFTKP
ncbi:hypothetical protein [Pedobacter sp. ASV28]|uniref:hypothetical protein n=1 Tax=Pedobacter sp. ASV28 TaxID=2795123 RepID=UPI0018EA36AF|nr:hypothetical protein [Pedobacter sp. ASV28]